MEPEELAVRCRVRDESFAAVYVVEEFVEVECLPRDLDRVLAEIRMMAERRGGIVAEQHLDATRRLEEDRVVA